MKILYGAPSGLNRRTILISGSALLLASCVSRSRIASPDAAAIAELRALEESANGRLGAYILDLADGTAFGWRADERFTHASSFKMSLAAMMLSKADAGQINLDEVLRWTKDDMLFVSPVTQANLNTGLSVRELARATLVTSDNTAANVLLRRFGGPAELTAFWRSIGDLDSRLDRYEPELNVTPPGTELDTTTPAAMARTTARLVYGDVLTHGSRAVLKNWMAQVKTGQGRIRSGFPLNWASGDKTGTGVGETKHVYVDLAYGEPPGRPPVVVTAYFEPTRPAEPMDPHAVAVLAAVGRIATASVLRT
ncbi:class A beta-lactamase [Altericroceibacterium xinjiangense]|uniref:class A beta-lactamase n=1 Tax=Altericroceibacterium xinjiangense TaxID=762261 RepID=UPI000F7DE00C|nr:class A beta-lactamase [Altericroceibacterium xinjiangense]